MLEILFDVDDILKYVMTDEASSENQTKQTNVKKNLFIYHSEFTYIKLF